MKQFAKFSEFRKEFTACGINLTFNNRRKAFTNKIIVKLGDGMVTF